MSGPIEPYRSRALSRQAVEREATTSLRRLELLTQGIRTIADDAYAPAHLDDMASIEPRETRVRDRSLRGKARRNARKAAR